MMKTRLEKIFLVTIFIAVAGLAYNAYKSFQFKNNPITADMQEKIDAKVASVERLISERLKSNFRAPVLVSDKLPSNLYGVTTYESNGKITIYLNKKRMRESFEYILDDVIPHEYAHAIMFSQGNISNKEGHGPAWQKICQSLDGKRCQTYVNHEDIISGKLPFYNSERRE